MAIATDATSNAQASATTVTATHTCTGSNLILFAGAWIQDGGTDKITGITYNGVSMTQIAKIINANEESMYLYYLINPATGANSLTMTKTGSDLGYVIGASYTGAKQSGQPDASTTNTGSSVTSLTTSVTTIANNCWTIIMAKAQANLSAGTGTTLRKQGPNNAQTGLYDSNGPITPAGSTSLQTTSVSTQVGHVMASFSPSIPNTASGNFLIFM